MADKATKPKATDAGKPDKAVADSKPAIVTNRPVLTDPPAADDTNAKEVPADPKPTTSPSAGKVKIEPLNNDVKPESDDNTTEKSGTSAAEAPAVTDSIDEDDNESKDGAPNADDEDLAAKRAAERQAQLDKIAESGTYHLPINQVVRRRSRHIAIAGAVLIVLLGIAWVDVALDAGLVSIPGVQPVTHFFSK